MSVPVLKAAEAMQRVCSSALDLVYPRSCCGCHGPVQRPGGFLCWECMREMEFVSDPFCERCGDPIDGAVYHRYECWWCAETHPSFERARSVARFRGAVRFAILALKYERASHLAGDLADLLVAGFNTHYANERIDCVTSVPLYAARRRARTYNQAGLLARHFSKRSGVPFEPGCLSKTRNTETQTRLNARQRKANVEGAYASTMPEWVRGRRILLIDDVMTTGATVNECATVLRKAQAASVQVLTVARG